MGKRVTNLRIPGPTPLPPGVLKSLSKQMINHRGPAYEEMQSRIIKNLKHFFGTDSELLLLTSSGMGGLESAVVNFFSRGEKAVFLTCGEFGNRWADIGRRYGLNVVHDKLEIGKGFNREHVMRILEREKNVKGVFITLNETSTGVLNPVTDIAKAVKSGNKDTLFLVDAISALGAVDLPMDEAGVDVLVSASQKAWMSPPGLSMIAVSPLAWEKSEESDLPKYYFDLKSYRDYNKKMQTPATPAVTALYGLDTALIQLEKEGKGSVFKRHLATRDYVRKRIKDCGFDLFVADRFASPTVTSVLLPDGIDGSKWITILRDDYNTVIAGGMGESKGKIIRIAHMGYFSREDLDSCIDAVTESYGKIK